MWELEGSTDDDLGYAYGQATISKMNDGNWYAVFGNGYNSVNGIAKLYIVNIGTGVGPAHQHRPAGPDGLAQRALGTHPGGPGQQRHGGRRLRG